MPTSSVPMPPIKLIRHGTIKTPHGPITVGGPEKAVLWLADKLKPRDPRVYHPMQSWVANRMPPGGNRCTDCDDYGCTMKCNKP